MGDHLGGYHVSPAGFAHMTHLLMSLAKGKLVLALEGGEGSTLVLLLQDCLRCENTNLNMLTQFLLLTVHIKQTKSSVLEIAE